MRKATILALGLALLGAMPATAQTVAAPAGKMTDQQLIKWAESQNACPGSSVLSAIPLAGGKVQVVCGYHASPQLGGLGGSGAVIGVVVGIVLIGAALGSNSSSTGTH